MKHIKINATGRHPDKVINWIDDHFTHDTKQITVKIDNLELSMRINPVKDLIEDQQALLGLCYKVMKGLML